MKFHITLINDSGFMLEHCLVLPITDQATWDEFMSMRAVKELLLLNPTMRIIDVTPDGMPDRYTDEQQLTNQLSNMGIKRSRNLKGVSVYESEDSEVDLDLNKSVDIDSLREHSEDV